MTGRRGRAWVRDAGVAAVDLSTRRSGVVDVAGVARSIVSLGGTVQDRNATMALRILKHVTKPPGIPWARVLLVEDLLKGVRMRGQHELAKLHGAVEQCAWHDGLPVGYVHPATLKKYATGSGRAEKADMLASWTAAHPPAWIPHPHDDDQVDALWLWALGVHHYTGEQLLEPRPWRSAVLAAVQLPKRAASPTTTGPTDG